MATMNGRAQVAEKQQQHECDKHRAFGEVFEYRVKCCIDQPRAIVKRYDLDAIRQNGAIEQLNFCLYPFEHVRGIFPFPHQHNPGNDVITVILTDDAFARNVADCDTGHVADVDRHAAMGGEDDVANIIRRAKQADAADQILLRALCHFAAADIGVAAAERGVKLLQAEAVVAHPGQVRVHLICLDGATHPDNVGHARNHPQVPLDHPIFQRPQVARSETITFESITINLANGGRERSDLRLNAGRQIGRLAGVRRLAGGRTNRSLCHQTSS